MGITNLKPWAKGVSGNPGGHPRLPTEIRIARKKNQAGLIKLVMSHFAMTDVQVIQKNEDTRTSQLEFAVQGVIEKAKGGDVNAFKFLIELMCGKIPEYDQESQAEEMSPEEKLEIMKRAVQVLETQVKDGQRSD